MFFDHTEQVPKKLLQKRNLVAPMIRSERDFEIFTDEDLYAAKGGVMVFDCEIYSNYFLIAFRCFETKRVVYFERTYKTDYNIQKLLFVLHNFCIVGFNSFYFDLPLIWLSMIGVSTDTLKFVTNQIIKGGWRPSDVEQTYKFKQGQINHIDLIEVAPLQASLKTYAGRLHVTRMQDLPFDPEATLTQEEMRHVLHYCINDLDCTDLLLNELSPQLALRSQLSEQYKQDLRSKSDAQIAEAVISKEVENLNGYYAKRPTIEPGTSFKYEVPDYVSYKSPILQHMLQVVKDAEFVVRDSGKVVIPEGIANLDLIVGYSSYNLTIGGLHSKEKSICHVSNESFLLIDRDVASFYPQIILNLGLYPKHLTENFLTVYNNIVQRRLAAKKEKNKVVADSLKITINGGFGKFGNKYSCLYSPNLLMAVTITGQLSLLMLIEAIELAEISVVSGNTDGIIIKCPVLRYDELNEIIAKWESITRFETEETRYKGVYSRDVNNYLAIKKDEVKAKGVYSERGSALNSVLSKNPEALICSDAVQALLDKGIDIKETIMNCKDIRRFVSVRNVKGGAEKDGFYLGKTVRFYYAEGQTGQINYAINGNKVPKSEGAKPCMDLPLNFPNDINYEYYIKEAEDMLVDIGYTKIEKQMKFF